MNSRQKAIKYAAMAFGILLAAVIVGGAGIAFLKITNIFGGNKGAAEKMDFSRDFSSEDIENLDFENMTGTMTIVTGGSFYIEAKNVPEDFVAKVEKGTLVVAYTKQQWSFSSWLKGDNNIEITITIPENFRADKAQIDNGSGKVVIDGLRADSISFNNGSGRMEAEEINCENMELASGSGAVIIKQAAVTDSIEIDSGSGSISLEAVETKGLDFDGGSGDFELSGRVDGNLNIDSGSGRTTLSLQNARSEYNIEADVGSGAFWLDGDKKKDDYVERNQGSEYEIEIRSGSGRVSIEFSKGIK